MNGVVFTAPTLSSLDACSVAEFKSEMRSATASGGRVALDFRYIRFLDSAGLGAILSLLGYLSERGGDLVLVGLSPAVQSVCDLVRLRQVIEIFSTRDEVLDYYAALDRFAAGF